MNKHKDRKGQILDVDRSRDWHAVPGETAVFDMASGKGERELW